MLSTWIELSASLTTILSVYFYSEKNVMMGAILGLLSQIAWWSLMYVSDLWGLIVINVVMIVLHTRALYRSFNEKDNPY